MLQKGGSVDDGVMLLACCGTAAPSLSCRSTRAAVPLQGNECDAWARLFGDLEPRDVVMTAEEGQMCRGMGSKTDRGADDQ